MPLAGFCGGVRPVEAVLGFREGFDPAGGELRFDGLWWDCFGGHFKCLGFGFRLGWWSGGWLGELCDYEMRHG